MTCPPSKGWVGNREVGQSRLRGGHFTLQHQQGHTRGNTFAWSNTRSGVPGMPNGLPGFCFIHAPIHARRRGSQATVVELSRLLGRSHRLAECDGKVADRAFHDRQLLKWTILWAGFEFSGHRRDAPVSTSMAGPRWVNGHDSPLRFVVL
jgi:hypothetical protein